MNRRTVCWLLALCVLATYVAAYCHAHRTGSPFDHNPSPHVHLTSTSNGHEHAAGHRHRHDQSDVEDSHAAADEHSPTGHDEGPSVDDGGEGHDDAVYLGVATAGRPSRNGSDLDFHDGASPFDMTSGAVYSLRCVPTASPFRPPPAHAKPSLPLYLLHLSIRC